MQQTYEGIVQHNTIHLPDNANFPDGTRVYVSAMPPVLDERQARRKARIWLAENVGDMCLPESATLNRHNQRQVWRFSIMLGSAFRAPRGPIGEITIDAETGEVLASATLPDELTRNAENLELASLPARE